MIILPHNCYCSEFNVFPSNWKTMKASVKKDWYISYRFYDPSRKDSHPKGKFVVCKKGINLFKTLEERQTFIPIAKEEILHNLEVLGFNPITQICTPPPEPEPEPTPVELILQEGEILADMPIAEALEKGRLRLKGYPEQTVSDIKSVVKYVTISTMALGLQDTKLKDITRKLMKLIIDNCNKSNDRKNKYITWLGVIFEELIDAEALEINPVEKIRKERVIRGIRETISKKDRAFLDKQLKIDNYNLWRFMHIYFHSGSRETELVAIKTEDVNLYAQEYKVLIKKGGQYVYKVKVIKDIAMPYWADLLSSARKGDYLFSTYLAPGERGIHADRINKLWKKYVKDPYGIRADFGSLKHSHSTEVKALIDSKAAAEHNSHTSTRMVDTVYDVERFSRADTTVKSLHNALA